VHNHVLLFGEVDITHLQRDSSSPSLWASMERNKQRKRYQLVTTTPLPSILILQCLYHNLRFTLNEQTLRVTVISFVLFWFSFLVYYWLLSVAGKKRAFSRLPTSLFHECEAGLPMMPWRALITLGNTSIFHPCILSRFKNSLLRL
jgi:hypothetical protein